MSLPHIVKLIIPLFFILPLNCISASGKDFVVVIDAGHGGKDAGALGRRTNEKTVNLGVAKHLRDLLNSNMKDSKVVMTRDKDYFVKLQSRADIANRNHADIFISIHANSVDKKSPVHNTIHGASVYTLGLKRSDTNLSVAMRENSVMKLEPDYTTTYEGFDPSSAESYIAFEMMQHSNLDQSIELAEAVQNQLVRTAGRKNNGVRQAPFWVLVRTSMPAILVELDYICNSAMEKFLMSDNGQQKLALAIYRGIEKYRGNTLKASKNGKVMADSRPKELQSAKEESEKEVAPKPVENKNVGNNEIIYKIQFLSSSATIHKGSSKFKGLAPTDHYTEGKIIKYTYGSFRSQSDASTELRRIRKLFPDAFIIKTRGGVRIK